MEETELNVVENDNYSDREPVSSFSPKSKSANLSLFYRTAQQKSTQITHFARQITTFTRSFENEERPRFSKRLSPILMTLQIFCFYPAHSIRRTSGNFLQEILRHRDIYVGILSVAAILFNAYMFFYNVDAMDNMANSPNGTAMSFTEILLNPVFVSIMISCQKPLISMFNLILFIVGSKKHKHLLKTLNVVDKALYDNFHCDPKIEKRNVCFILVTAVTFLGPLGLRIAQAMVMKEELGNFWLIDLSFVFVPLWAMWMTLPLFYFETINQVIRFWCSEIRKLILENYRMSFDPRPLKFYYMKFIEIINVQVATQGFFGIFMLWSLIWSVFTLALAIYFVTQTDSILPPGMPQEHKTGLLFLIGWSAIQVVTGVLYILVIAASGTANNEAMRSVLDAVQDIVTEIETEDDKFQVDCFTNKLSMQNDMWGVNIAGAFPMERGFLFTLLGLITTYALVLLELKGGGGNGSAPETK